MAGTDASEGQALWQPGGAEEDGRLREGNRHLHLAYGEEEEDAPVELLTDPAWRTGRETDVHMFLSVPGITSKEQLPGELRNLTLALITYRFPNYIWTHVYTGGSAEVGIKTGGSGVFIRYPDGDTTSRSVSGGLPCSDYRVEILAICTAAEHLSERVRNIAIFTDSLLTLEVLSSADPDQMIQGLHPSLAKLTAQFSVPRPPPPPLPSPPHTHTPPPVGACSCGTDRKRNSRQTCKNLQSGSADRTLSPTERPRRFSTLGTLETGRKKTVDTRAGPA